MAERICNDKFRWWDARAYGSEPGAEGGPNEIGEGDRKILKQTLSDDSGLDENMIGADFAFDLVPIIR